MSAAGLGAIEATRVSPTQAGRLLCSASSHVRHSGDDSVPILLLHGFLATPRALGRLAVRLSRSGYRAHCVDLGGGRFDVRTVDELACILAERVEQLARDHPGERIDLVGHSQGGLVGRYYVQKLNGAHRVRHLVTLGTPHRGTPWARSGLLVGRTLPSLRQMAPGSQLLRDLTDESFPDSVRLTSIYSRLDPFCPPSSCRLERGQGTHLKNVEVARGGHLVFLSSAQISSIVRRELESVEPPSAAGPRFAYAASRCPPRGATVDGPHGHLRDALDHHPSLLLAHSGAVGNQ